MGYSTVVAPINDSGTGESLSYFNNRMYLATSWYSQGSGSQGIVGAYLYRASNTSNAWDLRLEIPGGNQPSDFITIIFQDKLYIVSGRNGNYVWRLNDTEDAVIPVVSTPTLDMVHDLLIFEDRLYACSQTGELIRLNLAGDAWETVCPRLGYWGDPVFCMTIFQNTIYANMWNYGLVKMNLARDAWEVVVDWSLTHNSMSNIHVFNDELYSTGSDNSQPYIYRLNSNETGWDIVCDTGEVLNNTMTTYNGMLYWSCANTLRRLNVAGDAQEIMLQYGWDPSVWIVTTEIAGNKLYFTTDFQSELVRYDTLVLDFVSDKFFDLAPATVNFSFNGSTDFPLTSLLWTFSDGETSTELNPSHTFIRGAYDISLAASNGVDSSTRMKANFIDSYSGSVFNIDTIEKLQAIGTPGNSLTSTPGFALHDSYVQTANIDASITATWNNGKGFTPICRTARNEITYNVFSGVYDGSSYNITGLHIHTPQESQEDVYLSDTAIFAACDAATFKNINLVDVNITNASGAFASSLVVANSQYPLGDYGRRNSVENCSVTGVFSTAYDCAGLVVNAGNFDFLNCNVDITIHATESAGIAAYCMDTTFTNCVSTCTLVNSQGSSGGISILGLNVQVNNCNTVVNITSFNNVGGLFGQLINSTINNCHSEGTVSGLSYVAGIAGFCVLSNNSTNLSSSCEVNAVYGYAGGLFGYFISQQYTLTNCYATGNVTSALSGSGVGGLIGSIQTGSYIGNCYATGNVLCDEGQYNVGGWAGSVYAFEIVIEDCYATGNVSGSAPIGGFIGYVGDCKTISNCHCTGSVTSSSVTTYYVGGFLGYCNIAEIKDSYTRSNVSCASQLYYVGGFVGNIVLRDRVLRCCSLGNIFAPKSINCGGFSGASYGGIFVECCSYGDLTCAIGSGFVSQSDSKFYNSFAKTDITCQIPGNSKNQEITRCQSRLGVFCRQIESDSPSLLLMTNSVTGMNILWHENTQSPKAYQDSLGPYINEKTEFRVFFDFTVKNCGDNTSVIEYGYHDWSNLMITGFKVKLFRQDYLTLPAGIEIYAVHESVESLILSQENSFNQQFSLICEKLGYKMRFYVNNTLVGTFDLNAITDSAQNQFLTLGGNEIGGIATEYEISKIAVETRVDVIDCYIAGFVGRELTSTSFFSKCYSAGRIENS